MVDNYPWDFPYKIIKKKVGGKPQRVESQGRDMWVARKLIPIRDISH